MSDVLRYAPVGAAALAVAFFLWRRRRLASAPPAPSAAFDGPATYDEARACLSGAGRGGDVGARSGVFAAGVERSGPDGTTLVLALADGTVSLFVRGGLGVAGLARVGAVRDAADALLAAVAAWSGGEAGGGDGAGPAASGGTLVLGRTERGVAAVPVRGDGTDADADLAAAAVALLAAARAAVGPADAGG